jgi:hypothetical protein
MLDDAGMDRLLTASLASAVPQLGPAFDARVMRRVRPRRLTPSGRLLLTAYTVAASAATAWAMWGLGPGVIAAGLAAVTSVAAGAGAYGRRLAGH